MGSKTKQIGTIGEQVVVAEFLKNNINVLLPIGDNLPYDMLIEINGSFKKIQVKTTEHIKDGKMKFSTNKSNPYTKINKKYTVAEIDLFAFYCIENGYLGIMPVTDCTANDTILRINIPSNNQHTKVKMAENYEFNKMIKEL